IVMPAGRGWDRKLLVFCLLPRRLLTRGDLLGFKRLAVKPPVADFLRVLQLPAEHIAYLLRLVEVFDDLFTELAQPAFGADFTRNRPLEMSSVCCRTCLIVQIAHNINPLVFLLKS